MQRELEATDDVLGDPDAVRGFVLDAGQRLGLGIVADRRTDVFRVPADTASRADMPPAVRFAMPPTAGPMWRISFTSPTPDGAEHLGRNHPFVAALARFLMEEALVWVRGAAWGPRGAQPEWLPDDEALNLAASPDANVPPAEKRQLIAAALDFWPALQDGLRAPLADRAAALRDSHSRVRRAVSQRVRQLAVVPQHPPDLVGMLLLQPVV